MQGEWTGELAGPDVWVTCRELIPASSVFAFLAEHREALFPAGMFADMYPSRNGRPSMPPQILAAAVTLQALHGLSDIETVQELRCDLRWKAACGLGLYDTAFDSSLLAYFRRRLSRSADPQRIFTAVRAVVAETGVLKGKTRRALDSTVLDDAVATQDTVTQIIAAIRRVAREVPGADALLAREHRLFFKPAPLTTAVAGGFSLDDFAIDTTAGQVTCPAGHTVPLTAPSGINLQRRAVFEQLCAGCELRERCTKAKRGRVLTIRPHHDQQTAARHMAATDPDWQAAYRRWRPPVERAVAWLVAGGNRRLRYRGTIANNTWIHTRAAALNLRTLINLGLTRTNGRWNLPTPA
ncbi:transposase [Actinospica durhamensis]|uniref:Transposase n=2 Tax=Actinospica durhamensis TaxID=1508375 RepID=A0A941IRQ3_9ACTN|nr:transposase [Actinospica durhamensis]MBR7834163.1 transposase [Actinospica durhamensis]